VNTVSAPDILTLVEVPPGSSALVGGKAARLAELARAGFPVPPGIVVIPLAERSAAHRLLAAVDRLADREARFAVRSSGMAEDGAETSFAGQYLSKLNVSRLDVPGAVEQVRRSGATERVAAYGGTAAAIPVLVQPMVPAVAAGVAFTADPVSGDRGTTIVTAVRGLGEGLVSGELNGEEWVVRHGRATPRGASEGVLKAATASAVAALARRVADRSGTPQDIEWAYDGHSLHLLQARPMTGLPASPSWDPGARGYFSRSFRFGEWISEPVTPLFESWLLRRMEERLHEVHRAWTGQVAPRPYHVVVNGWYFYSLNFMPTSVRALGRSLPFILAHLVRDPRRVSAMFPPTARLGANLYERAWREELLPRYLAAVDDATKRVERLDPAELVELIDELAVLAGEYFASVAVVAGYAYKAELPLAMFHRRHVAPVVGGSHLPLLAGLTPPRPAPPHAVVSLDWSYPTAGEGSGRQEGLDITGRHAALAETRAAAEASARSSVAASARRLTKLYDLLAEAQRAAMVREEQLSHFTRPWPVLRRALRRIGESLVRSGTMTDAGDVHFLTHDELVSALGASAPDSLVEQVRERRAARRHAMRLAAPMAIGRPPWLLDRILSGGRSLLGAAPPSSNTLVVGVAASPGRITGVVRVIRDPAGGAVLQPGEILVAPLTAPAWTPLFAIAGAVVTDIGSPLAHASIIAREYGIPAVVGCGDATLRLRDGQRVTVDGSAGLVEAADEGLS
jgi:phosphohistidine swiveling domain-containing protein